MNSKMSVIGVLKIFGSLVSLWWILQPLLMLPVVVLVVVEFAIDASETLGNLHDVIDA